MKIGWHNVDIKKCWVRMENRTARWGLFLGGLLLAIYGILYYASDAVYYRQTGRRIERSITKAEKLSARLAEVWLDTPDADEGMERVLRRFSEEGTGDCLLCLFEDGKLVYWNKEMNEPDSVIYNMLPAITACLNDRVVYPFVYDRGDRRLVLMLEVADFIPKWREAYIESTDMPRFRVRSDHPRTGIEVRDRTDRYLLSVEPITPRSPFGWVGAIAWTGALIVVVSFALSILKRMTIYNAPIMLFLLFVGLFGIWIVVEYSHLLPQNYPIFKADHPLNKTLVKLFGLHFTMGNILMTSILFLIYILIKARARYKLKIYFRNSCLLFRRFYLGLTALSYGVSLGIGAALILLLVFDHFAFKTVYEAFTVEASTVVLYLVVVAVNATVPLLVLHMNEVFKRREVVWIVIGMFLTGTATVLGLWNTMDGMGSVVLAFMWVTLLLVLFQHKFRLQIFFSCYVGITALFLTFMVFHDTLTGNIRVPRKIAVAIYNNKKRLLEGPYDYILNAEREWRQLSYYSFIKVENRQVVDFGGHYVYGVYNRENRLPKVWDDRVIRSVRQNEGVFEANGFMHYALLSQDRHGKIVIVSYPKVRFVDLFSMFLYLFMVLWLGVALLFGIAVFLPKMRHFRISLYKQVRATILLTVVLSALAVLFMMVRYIVREQEKISKSQLFTLFNTTISDFNTLFKVMPYTPDNLELWANDMKTKYWLDLNIYDESGTLLACSNPYALKNELVPIRMNPEVFRCRNELGNLMYREENIQGTECFSFYYKLRVPNTDKDIFLHAVFFGNFYEMEGQPTVINILNVLLIVVFLSIVISGLFYRQIMKPIRLIQTSIRNIRYRQRIENSQYDKKSEIGQLLEQYNRTIDELTATYTELARHERQDAWRMIARQMAHELKNPLTPIKLKAQMILHRRKTGDARWDDKIDESLQLIVSQTEILANIITEFSSLGKINEKPPVRVHIDKMCRELISFYSCFHGVTIHYENLDTSLYANVNYDNLWSVILNLISNAVSAVHSVKDMREGHVVLRVRSDGPQHIEISVSDNGCGIPENEQTMIFTPNFTTKKNGSGLGLVISQQMVRAMNGRLYFESKEGVGSVFYIVIEQALPPSRREEDEEL